MGVAGSLQGTGEQHTPRMSVVGPSGINVANTRHELELRGPRTCLELNSSGHTTREDSTGMQVTPRAAADTCVRLTTNLSEQGSKLSQPPTTPFTEQGVTSGCGRSIEPLVRAGPGGVRVSRGSTLDERYAYQQQPDQTIGSSREIRESSQSGKRSKTKDEHGYRSMLVLFMRAP